MKHDNMKEYALPFAAWELRLYLDTHPDDECALNEYRRLCESIGDKCNYACHTADAHGGYGRSGDARGVTRENGCGCGSDTRGTNRDGGYSRNGNTRGVTRENGCGCGSDTRGMSRENGYGRSGDARGVTRENGCGCDSDTRGMNRDGGYSRNGNTRGGTRENDCGCGSDTRGMSRENGNGGGGNYGGRRSDSGNYTADRGENSGCGCDGKNDEHDRVNVWSWIEGPWPWEPEANVTGGDC